MSQEVDSFLRHGESKAFRVEFPEEFHRRLRPWIGNLEAVDTADWSADSGIPYEERFVPMIHQRFLDASRHRLMGEPIQVELTSREMYELWCLLRTFEADPKILIDLENVFEKAKKLGNEND